MIYLVANYDKRSYLLHSSRRLLLSINSMVSDFQARFAENDFLKNPLKKLKNHYNPAS